MNATRIASGVGDIAQCCACVCVYLDLRPTAHLLRCNVRSIVTSAPLLRVSRRCLIDPPADEHNRRATFNEVAVDFDQIVRTRRSLVADSIGRSAGERARACAFAFARFPANSRLRPSSGCAVQRRGPQIDGLPAGPVPAPGPDSRHPADRRIDF
jgi:hypothetical protein